MFCNKCGYNYQDADVRVCPNCGAKRKLNAEMLYKDISKLILPVGVFLVIFASILLGVFNWDVLSPVFKIGFLGFETAAFFIFSLLLKAIGSKIYRVFFLISCFLLPFIFILLPVYDLLPSFIMSGAGIYVYLAISLSIIGLLYLLFNIFFKSYVLRFLYLLCFDISVVYFLLFFFKDNYTTMILIYLAYVFVMNILTAITKNISMKINLALINSFIYVCIIANFFYTEKFSLLVSGLLFSGVIINILFMMFNIKNNIIRSIIVLYLYPFIYLFTLYFNFEQNIDFYIFNFLIILTLYVFIYLYKSKGLRIVSLIATYLYMLCIFVMALFDNNGFGIEYGTIIISSFMLILNFINIIFDKFKFIHSFVPLTIIICVMTIFDTFHLNNNYYLIIITSLLFIIYIILKIVKNKFSLAYYIWMLLLMFISLFTYDSLLINILFIVMGAVLFFVNYIFKEHGVIKAFSYIILLLLAYSTFTTSYYGFLGVSFITVIIAYILGFFKKLNIIPYVITLQVIMILITIFNSYDHTIIILIIHAFLFIISYIFLISKTNNTVYRIIYTFIMFILLYNIIKVIFVPVVISSLIGVLVTLFILIILYLTSVENKYTFTLLSLFVLIPYYTLVGNTFSSITELYIMPFVFYTIIFTEIIPFTDNTVKRVLTLIPMILFIYIFMVTYNGVGSIICDLVLSLIIIFVGLYRKYMSFIYIGIIFIIGILIIRLFTIVSSALAVFVLIIVGFILMGIAIFLELKKK